MFFEYWRLCLVFSYANASCGKVRRLLELLPRDDLDCIDLESIQIGALFDQAVRADPQRLAKLVLIYTRPSTSSSAITRSWGGQLARHGHPRHPVFGPLQRLGRDPLLITLAAVWGCSVVGLEAQHARRELGHLRSFIWSEGKLSLGQEFMISTLLKLLRVARLRVNHWLLRPYRSFRRLFPVHFCLVKLFTLRTLEGVLGACRLFKAKGPFTVPSLLLLDIITCYRRAQCSSSTIFLSEVPHRIFHDPWECKSTALTHQFVWWWINWCWRLL